jgi:hypothetical protein
MNLSQIAVGVFQIGSPVLIAILSWLATKLAQLIQARVKNEYLRGVLVRLDDTVLTVVREIQQVSVDTIKAAAPDGKLTPDVKATLKQAAVGAIKQHLGSQGVADVARVLGIDGDGVDRLIGTRVEATVHDLKQQAAHVTNGVNKGGGAPYPLAA